MLSRAALLPARGRVGFLAAALVAAVLAGPVPSLAAVAPEQPPLTTPPDVIVIMTDDQRLGSEKGMPYLWGQLRREMTHYPNAQIPNSNCCPSRTSFLSGRYSHTTGVWDNTATGPPGGWWQFANSGYERRTIATALQRRGYHTAMMGKYINQFFAYNDPAFAWPPGWSDFRTYLRGNAGYWTDTHPVHNVAPGYSTDVLGDAAADVIRTAPADKPLFLLYTPYAPHSPATAGPYAGSAAKSGALAAMRRGGRWGNPSVGEEDRSDKPMWLQAVKPLQIDFHPTLKYPQVRNFTEKQADTLMGVDANVAKIVAAQRQARNWSNTVVVYLSDNGMAWGDHALFDKTTPYRLTGGIPLLIKYPSSTPSRPATDDRLINQLDVTATIADLTGAPLGTSGRSALEPASRGGLLLHSPTSRRVYRYWHPAYCAWRTKDELYARYADGSEELYLYRSDPYELTNQAKNRAHARVKAKLAIIAHRACSPKPPGYTSPSLRVLVSQQKLRSRAVVRPGIRGAQLQVQRRTDGGWSVVGRCKVKKTQWYRAVRTFQVRSKGIYRVRVLSRDGFTGSYSKPRALKRTADRFRCT